MKKVFAMAGGRGTLVRSAKHGLGPAVGYGGFLPAGAMVGESLDRLAKVLLSR